MTDNLGMGANRRKERIPRFDLPEVKSMVESFQSGADGVKDVFDEIQTIRQGRWGKQTSTHLGQYSPKYDYQFHSCNQFPDPPALMPSHHLSGSFKRQGMELTASQVASLHDISRKIEFDEGLFNAAVAKAKGLWVFFLADRSDTRSESKKDFREIARALYLLAPNSFEIIRSQLTTPTWTNFGRLERPEPVYIPGAFSPHRLIENETFQFVEFDEHEKLIIIAELIFERFASENFRCQHFALTTCSICQDQFWPQAEVQSVRFGQVELSCGNCLAGLRNELYVGGSEAAKFDLQRLRALYVFALREFVKRFNFIPSASLDRWSTLESSLLQAQPNEWADIFRTISILPTNETAKELFGSWAHLLDHAELLHAMRRGHGGYQSIASDGHHCLSLGERQVCEYLASNGFTHEKEPMYPHDPELNPSGLMRGDFRVGKVWIEFAGRLADESYADRIETKRQLATKSGFVFIEVNPQNVLNLEFLGAEIKRSRKRK
jgi:hypothetical protein